MSDEKSVVLHQRKTIELVDGSTTKAELLELEMDEIRENLNNLARIAEAAVVDAKELAYSSQHPDAYRALSGVITAAAAVNKEAAAILKMKKDLLIMEKKGGVKEAPADEQHNNITNSNVIVATTTDVLEMIRKKSGDVSESD